MSRPHVTSKSVLVCLLALAMAGMWRVSADVGPTTYEATGIKPANAAGVRMKDAKVDIEWGSSICELSAVFEMENVTEKPVAVNVGFPMDVLNRSSRKLKYSFAFDGVPVPARVITRGLKAGQDADGYDWHRPTAWLYCRHIFKPGVTTITIKTQVPAILEPWWPCREALNYILETGGLWDGPIGREEVNIHFPQPIEPGQIFSTSPKNYTVKGGTVQWVFENIKPKGGEYDVRIDFLRPDAQAVLTAERKALEKDPENADLTLALVKSLFSLRFVHGEVGRVFISWQDTIGSFTQKEYDTLLSRITSKEDRSIFRSQLLPRGNDTYGVSFYNATLRAEDYQAVQAGIEDEGVRKEFEAHSHLQEDGKYRVDSDFKRGGDLLRILDEAGYEPAGTKSPHVDEARTMLEALLKKEPHNAAAWNVYLANYDRFRLTQAGAVFRGKVAEAHGNCPDDPTIGLWYHYTTDSPDDPELYKKIWKAAGELKTEFPFYEHDYY